MDENKDEGIPGDEILKIEMYVTRENVVRFRLISRSGEKLEGPSMKGVFLEWHRMFLERIDKKWNTEEEEKG